VASVARSPKRCGTTYAHLELLVVPPPRRRATARAKGWSRLRPKAVASTEGRSTGQGYPSSTLPKHKAVEATEICCAARLQALSSTCHRQECEAATCHLCTSPLPGPGSVATRVSAGAVLGSRLILALAPRGTPRPPCQGLPHPARRMILSAACSRAQPHRRHRWAVLMCERRQGSRRLLLPRAGLNHHRQGPDAILTRCDGSSPAAVVHGRAHGRRALLRRRKDSPRLLAPHPPRPPCLPRPSVFRQMRLFLSRRT
jgi:hypothetical protein